MLTRPLTIELSWPAKKLSPNARVHPIARHRFAKAAKTEAGWATRLVRPFDWAHEVNVTAYPPDTWRSGDKVNFIARLKHHLDGIAEMLGVNDRQFESPRVTWAERCQCGRVEIEVLPL